MTMRATGRFILVDDQPRPAELGEWSEFMGRPERWVRQTELHTPLRVVRIETSFTGWDFRSPWGGPYFFSTKVIHNETEFGPRWSETLAIAMAAHSDVVKGMIARYSGIAGPALDAWPPCDGSPLQDRL